MAEAGVQLSGTSSAATCSNTGSDSLAALANSLAVVQLELTALQPCSFYKKPLQPCSHAALFNSLAVLQLQLTALQLCSPNNSLVSVSDCESLKSRMLSWLVKPPGISDFCVDNLIADVHMPYPSSRK